MFVLLLVAWALYSAGFAVFQRTIIYPRNWMPPAPDKIADVPGMISLDVEHADGRSEGWLIPAAHGPAPVVIYTHGNGELIDHAVHLLDTYRDAGFAIALLEYRGYGRSDGDPSEEALITDALAFYDQVTERPEVDGAKVVLHGRSLGGGVASAVAAQRPVHALVLESTFTGLAPLAWRLGAPGFLLRDRFETLKRLGEIRAPIFLSHGANDRVVPYSHGKALAERAKVTLFTQACGHNDCGTRAYWAAVIAFLDGAGLTPKS